MTTSDIRSHSPSLPAQATARPIPQYSPTWLLGVWAAAALPMAALAWLVAPRLAASIPGPAPLGQALLICLTLGMIWQFALVLLLVRREQGTLSWTVVRAVLWLQSPRSPRTGRVGGRVWLVLLPLAAAFYAEQLVPLLPHPAVRDLGSLLGTGAGSQLLHGNWALLALGVTMFVSNTVLGEELLFRGYLLPRMNGAFGDLGLARQRPPFRRLSPARLVEDPRSAARRADPRLPDQALPQRLDRHRGAQHADRVPHRPPAAPGALRRQLSPALPASSSPSRWRTTRRARSRTAGSSFRTNLVSAPSRTACSSKASRSGSSWAGSSCCSSAVAAKDRSSAVKSGLDGGDPVLDRPGAGAHLQRGGGEEAAAGEDAALHVAEERLARRRQLGQAGAGRERGLYDFLGRGSAPPPPRWPAGVPAWSRSGRKGRSC